MISFESNFVDDSKVSSRFREYNQVSRATLDSIVIIFKVELKRREPKISTLSTRRVLLAIYTSHAMVLELL